MSFTPVAAGGIEPPRDGATIRRLPTPLSDRRRYRIPALIASFQPREGITFNAVALRIAITMINKPSNDRNDARPTRP
jgi:hypothetical protein